MAHERSLQIRLLIWQPLLLQRSQQTRRRHRTLHRWLPPHRKMRLRLSSLPLRQRPLARHGFPRPRKPHQTRSSPMALPLTLGTLRLPMRQRRSRSPSRQHGVRKRHHSLSNNDRLRPRQKHRNLRNQSLPKRRRRRKRPPRLRHRSPRTSHQRHHKNHPRPRRLKRLPRPRRRRLRPHQRNRPHHRRPSRPIHPHPKRHRRPPNRLLSRKIPPTKRPTNPSPLKQAKPRPTAPAKNKERRVSRPATLHRLTPFTPRAKPNS